MGGGQGWRGQIKPNEFNSNALSNAVASFFSHSTSKTTTKTWKKLVITFDRALPLDSSPFSNSRPFKILGGSCPLAPAPTGSVGPYHTWPAPKVSKWVQNSTEKKMHCILPFFPYYFHFSSSSSGGNKDYACKV